MRTIAIPPLIALLFLTGCGTLQLNPVTNESRAVQAVADASKTVTVAEGMVWYDGSPAVHGLRFPPGRYVLEAEDADYWYLRSPAPLEFRVFKGDKVEDSRDIPGGLMIAKQFNMLPAGGYIDGDGGAKVMVWKLGHSFLDLEGRYWSKSF